MEITNFPLIVLSQKVDFHFSELILAIIWKVSFLFKKGSLEEVTPRYLIALNPNLK